MTGERVKEEAMIGCDRCKHCDRLGCNQHEDVTGPYRATIPKEPPMSDGEDRTTPRPWKVGPGGPLEPEADIWTADGTQCVLHSIDAPVEANAALIVEAVNNYDRLRAALSTTPALRTAVEDVLVTLERVVTDSESQHPGGWGPDVTTVADLRDCQRVLRAALEGDTHE